MGGWKKQDGSTRSADDGWDAKIRRLKRELARGGEERDILKGGGIWRIDARQM